MASDPTLTVGVAVALVTAAGSLVGTVVNIRATRRLEEEKADREEVAEERRALREYQYAARVRLYEQYEPLLFQLVETTENALHRVHSLARSARLGNLTQTGDGWLAPGEYFLISTLYTLLAPLAAFTLMRRRLTFVDLSTDAHIARQYQVAKQLYWVLSDDFELAAMAPELPYEPFIANWQHARQRDPSRHWRQGVASRRIDNAADRLLLNEGTDAARLMSFGEFDAQYADPQSDLRTGVAIVADVFEGFHPASRPILWRILITKSYIYAAFVAIGGADPKARSMTEPWAAIARQERKLFDWRADPAEIPDGDVLDAPFDAAEQYLRARLDGDGTRHTVAV